MLEEGTYHVIDTGEPEGDDVQSHAESGATATLEVSGGDDGAELPEVDASIEMADFDFVTDGFEAGTNRFLLRNTGEELHHTLVVPINGDAAFEAVKEYMTSEEGDDGPPPVDFEKLQGTTVLDAGREQIDELELVAGRYALVVLPHQSRRRSAACCARHGERAHDRVGGDEPGSGSARHLLSRVRGRRAGRPLQPHAGVARVRAREDRRLREAGSGRHRPQAARPATSGSTAPARAR